MHKQISHCYTTHLFSTLLNINDTVEIDVCFHAPVIYYNMRLCVVKPLVERDKILKIKNKILNAHHGRLTTLLFTGMYLYPYRRFLSDYLLQYISSYVYVDLLKCV